MTADEMRTTFRCAASKAALAHAMGLTPYPWQQTFLASRSRRTILNVHRRGGKDYWVAVAGVHHCMFDLGACIVALSASERQALEWLHTFRQLYDQLPKFMRPALVVDNATTLELANGARVLSLPCTEAAPRGWGATLLFLNEAARIPDSVYFAARPTVAANKGSIIIASTPNGPQGFFHDTWESDAQWERFLVRANESPHLDPAFLEEEKAALGSRWYAQEYECAFTASDEGIFAPELIDRAFGGGFPPLFTRSIPKPETAAPFSPLFRSRGTP